MREPARMSPLVTPLSNSATPHGIFQPRTPVQYLKDKLGRFHKEPEMSMFVLQGTKQANLSKFAAMPRGAERREAAWQALVGVAQASQDPVRPKLDELKKSGVVGEYMSA